jgi:hypothetical protein
VFHAVQDCLIAHSYISLKREELCQCSMCFLEPVSLNFANHSLLYLTLARRCNVVGLMPIVFPSVIRTEKLRNQLTNVSSHRISRTTSHAPPPRYSSESVPQRYCLPERHCPHWQQGARQCPKGQHQGLRLHECRWELVSNPNLLCRWNLRFEAGSAALDSSKRFPKACASAHSGSESHRQTLHQSW